MQILRPRQSRLRSQGRGRSSRHGGGGRREQRAERRPGTDGAHHELPAAKSRVRNPVNSRLRRARGWMPSTARATRPLIRSAPPATGPAIVPSAATSTAAGRLVRSVEVGDLGPLLQEDARATVLRRRRAACRRARSPRSSAERGTRAASGLPRAPARAQAPEPGSVNSRSTGSPRARSESRVWVSPNSPGSRKPGAGAPTCSPRFCTLSPEVETAFHPDAAHRSVSTV